MLRLTELRLPLNHGEEALRPALLQRLALADAALLGFTVFKRSYDARKKSAVQLIYTVDCELADEAAALQRWAGDPHVRPTPDMSYRFAGYAGADFYAASKLRPLVIGFGPCGIFAALILAQMGLRPIVLERGKAMRERTVLLTDGPADPAWLDALEARMAKEGAAMAKARAGTLEALAAEIEARADRPFPQARLSFDGDFGRAEEGELAAHLAANRDRDAAAGRALSGPHRGDLAVIHAGRDRPAAECSTGEQKALILNLILAQASRLSRVISQPNPIVLLDEVAAHLDRSRRAALFDEIEALGLQAFLTGTDEALFESLGHRALGVRVEDGCLLPLE